MPWAAPCPRWAAAAWPVAVALLAAVGCAPPEPHVVVDLVVEGPDLRLVTEPVVIDIGTEGARRHLGRGWYYDERRQHDGETFAWSRGQMSELRFHLGWRRDLTIELVGRPFDYENATPQEVSFELNGTVVGPPVALAGGGERRLAVELAAGHQVEGENRLILRYGRVDAPADVTPGATDRRQLAVAWSRAAFDTVDPVEPALGTGSVRLPAGARLERFVELSGVTRFAAHACRSTGAPPAVLSIELLGEDAAAAGTLSWTCEGKGVEHALGDWTGLTRVRLTVRPQNSDAVPHGVELELPRLLTGARGASPADHEPAPTGAIHPRPNVVIYLVDALRSDRLGVYGCDRPLSPRLDGFAAEGVVFTDGVAQSSWTKAAVASIFTGLWPRAHGVNGPDDRLADELPTLPEMLDAAGYETSAVVANAYVGRPFGFARGFDHFEFIDHRRGRSEIVHEHVTAWLEDRRDSETPFFLYIHTIDPHAPYAPPPDMLEAFAPSVSDPSVGRVETVRGLVLGTVAPTAELGRDLRALYDGEVAANDRSFGLLLDELERLGELDDTVVIFTSDHGEAFGEHGTWTHGLDLFNEVLSIPLVVRLPGAAGAGQRIDDTVQHIDLLPTLLALTGTPAPAGALPGHVLVDASGAARPPGDRAVLSYLDYWDRTGAAILHRGWKLIRPLSADFGADVELYHHIADRFEHDDLYRAKPVRAGWLESRLADALTVRTGGEITEVDAETRRQLEALGYMQ